MMYDGWMMGNGWGWAGWTMMAVVMVLFWGGLITANHPRRPLSGHIKQHDRRAAQKWTAGSR